MHIPIVLGDRFGSYTMTFCSMECSVTYYDRCVSYIVDGTLRGILPEGEPYLVAAQDPSEDIMDLRTCVTPPSLLRSDHWELVTNDSTEEEQDETDLYWE